MTAQTIITIIIIIIIIQDDSTNQTMASGSKHVAKLWELSEPLE